VSFIDGITGAVAVNITRKDLITNHLILPLWKEQSLEVIDQFISPTADIQTTFLSGQGPDILKRSVIATFTAFPYFKMDVEDIIQIGSQLIYRWQAEAKHEGSIMGIPKTGKIVSFQGAIFVKPGEDLISQYHSFSNIVQVLRSTYETFTLDPQMHLKTELQKLTEFPLTRREIECLSFWLRGCSIKETAKQMGGLSARTIQTYRENIKKKFNVYSFQKIFSTIQQSGIMPLFLESEYAIGA
jgi:DNA-binding CsgD family transcriptional regulator/predicted ester cyclase